MRQSTEGKEQLVKENGGDSASQVQLESGGS